MTISASVVVVHHEGLEELRRCVPACLAMQEAVEVIVVDNPGAGGPLHPEAVGGAARLLTMPRNLGYGRAANAGLAAARGEAALVANQDVVPEPDTLARLLSVAEASAAWVVGPTLVDAAGTPARPKSRFPHPLRWPGPSPGGPGWEYVPWISGATMLLAPGDGRRLRFDPRLFMFVEDEELCYRAWRDGGRVAVATAARVFHAGGTSTRARWSTGAITRRTIRNRARMVRWHAGWSGVARYAAWLARRPEPAPAHRPAR